MPKLPPLYQYHCNQCGHDGRSKYRKPTMCARCRSTRWAGPKGRWDKNLHKVISE